MVTPARGFSEKVRARLLELSGKDPGPFQIRDIFPGENFYQTSEEERVEAIAQSLFRMVDSDSGPSPTGDAPCSDQPQTDVRELARRLNSDPA